METNLGSVEEKMDGIIEEWRGEVQNEWGAEKDEWRQEPSVYDWREHQGRERERMTNDQKGEETWGDCSDWRGEYWSEVKWGNLVRLAVTAKENWKRWNKRSRQSPGVQVAYNDILLKADVTVYHSWESRMKVDTAASNKRWLHQCERSACPFLCHFTFQYESTDKSSFCLVLCLCFFFMVWNTSHRALSSNRVLALPWKYPLPLSVLQIGYLGLCT